MEIASAQPLAPRCRIITSSCSCTSSLAAPPFQLKLHSSVVPQSSLHLHCSLSPLRGARVGGARQQAVIGTARAASFEAAGAASTGVAERWLLQPIGDGDTRHIGFKVEMPGVFEIASNEVTVGRLPEKADMVIPVATVSGLHARIQKTGGNLLVTDLDSTNGTFINEKRLRPGVAAAASPGSRITFGDTHLAIFLVSKAEVVETSNPQESSEKSETNPQESSEKSENEDLDQSAESAS
ncbi:uncharacterized protein LOC116211955 [Punica granatum]|uniref:FHA domain-containing protein n=2 Tax=Punica granatum TaxID=22663 RepID=A0A218WAG2_PUNGR|nr:uncharacterized protein LOC116211955 [Punica granatum]OWM69072.1 hypothetical protein CDL15_Pgr025259 [Punica granatum]PKI73307.1 hypothetical protein CRG98_006245 [Punica granatum]